ncbi:hypothetical protein IWX49DRAFT_575140 [Phyllosticta citricarpa]|uniref:Uncharacterized protein n=2 Tax=Phyllosticta TaxID=121621 RepID=A0ABR1M6Q1_9PEZI
MAMEFSISSISWSLRRDCKEYAPQLVQQVEALHIASRDFEDADFLPQPDTPLRGDYELLVGRCYANLQELEGLINYRRQCLRRGNSVVAESTGDLLQRLMAKLLENAQAFGRLQEAVEAAAMQRSTVVNPPVIESPTRQPYAETVVDSTEESFEKITAPIESELPFPVGPDTARDHSRTNQNSTTERQPKSGPRPDKPRQRARRRTSDNQSVWSSAADCGNVDELPKRLVRRARRKEKSTQELHAEIRREEAARHTRSQPPLDSWQAGHSWSPPPPHQFHASPYLDSSLLNPVSYYGYPFYPTAAGWQNTYQQHPYQIPGSPAPPTYAYNLAPNSATSGQCSCASRPECERVFYVDDAGTCHVCLHW